MKLLKTAPNAAREYRFDSKLGLHLLMAEQPKLVGALSVNVVGVILKVSLRFF
jgi:hypothetical protein